MAEPATDGLICPPSLAGHKSLVQALEHVVIDDVGASTSTS